VFLFYRETIISHFHFSGCPGSPHSGSQNDLRLLAGTFPLQTLPARPPPNRAMFNLYFGPKTPECEETKREGGQEGQSTTTPGAALIFASRAGGWCEALLGAYARPNGG
jgi:hypothetical protein